MATYDYIVTGGGSAGCVLAARLSEDADVSVLLLEAGGRDGNFLFHWPAGFAKMTKGIASWGWSTVPQKHMQGREIWFTQAKVIGGGSSINAQIYTRGNALDYDAWSEAHGCDGWSYREILPYFRRAESNERFNDDFHGIEGPLGVSMPRATLPVCDAFIRAAQEYGMPYNPDFNGRTQRGVGFYQLTQRDARRSSAAVAFLKPAESRPNLTVMTGAQATRVVVEKGRAVGVEVRHGGQTRTMRAAREVIVSSGAIGSPRLLMLSGIGPADHLRSVGVDVVHDLPGVGANLQDHIDICTISELSGPHSYDGWDRLHKTIWAGLQYLMFKSGPAAASLFETGAFWYADEAARSPDIQFHLGQGSGIEKGIAKIDGAGITLNSAFMRPRSRGTVRLASSDPMAAPLIDPNYWSDPYDLDMALKGLEMAREILLQPALSGFVRKEVLPGPGVTRRSDLFDYACRMAKTDHHPVGTCKMGHDGMAVVDPTLKLHGIDGLRVCDASIMPVINSSNTNAPTIMIGEKGADLIRGLEPLAPVVFSWERNADKRYAVA
ncbi:GMC family oxidoreductase [Tropicibacter alexandrii]|uniref:GMC family oxidoreductase n=1 Tax=Tropicibacter alexandrii TaxID=2267683 RepID=UPI000EF52349|nr:GMC family oxidoreductase N-terminal domain-containing protein [Tropicibacter alexandrii]